MVAGSVSMEKAIPTITTPAADPEVELRPKTYRKSIALVSWASAVTAILLVVLIWGAVYVTELKGRECKTTTTSTGQNGQTKDYHREYENKKDGTKEKEDIHLDEADKSQLIVTKDDSGNIALIAAINYNTKISAAYVPQSDECYLMSGENTDYWDNWGSEKNKTETVPEDVFEEDFKSSGNKVTDLSILPKAIKPYCSGKANYWVQPDEKDDEESTEVSRDKRAICIRYWRCYYYYCIRWGRWAICRRCYIYYIRCYG